MVALFYTHAEYVTSLLVDSAHGVLLRVDEGGSTINVTAINGDRIADADVGFNITGEFHLFNVVSVSSFLIIILHSSE